MTWTPALVLHVTAGIVAVFSGSAALIVRKGSPAHRLTGKIFVFSMMLMALGGAYLAMMKSQRGNVLAGSFTFYLVASAWVTVIRRENQSGLLERLLLMVALGVGSAGLIFGWESAHAATRTRSGGNTAMFLIFAVIALLSASGDVRLLLRGGTSGAGRMLRHVWRMCLALFVASGSLFLGTASDPVLRRSGFRARLFPPELRATHLPSVPVLILVALSIFWICRVAFTDAYRTRGEV